MVDIGFLAAEVSSGSPQNKVRFYKNVQQRVQRSSAKLSIVSVKTLKRRGIAIEGTFLGNRSRVRQSNDTI